MSLIRSTDPAEIARCLEVASVAAKKLKHDFHFGGSGEITVGFAFDDAIVPVRLFASTIRDLSVAELAEHILKTIRAAPKLPGL